MFSHEDQRMRFRTLEEILQYVIIHCNYMQLHVTTCHLQLCFTIFTTSHHLLDFAIIFATMV